MYYIVHVIFLLAGFVAGTFAWASVCIQPWASVCIQPFLGPEAAPFWYVGGFVGMVVGWWTAWMLVTSVSKPFGMVGLALSLTPLLGLAALRVLNLGLAARTSPLVYVLWLICLLPPPVALVTNIVAVCRDKSKVLGTIGLVISVATCTIWLRALAMWLLGLPWLILIWKNGPICP